MLSQTSRQEIVKRIESTIGYPLNEENLTPATRQAITNISTVQRHLYVITEILRGERSRIDRSAFLSMASRLGKDSGRTERAALANEIGKRQEEVDRKVSDISQQVLSELDARQSGQPPPKYKGGIEMVQLKCPSCGAPLPLPTGSFSSCQYCNATIRVQDISSQIKTMIQGI